MKTVTKIEKIELGLKSIKIEMDKANADSKSYETLNKAIEIFNKVKNTKEFKDFAKDRFESHSSSYDIEDTATVYYRDEILRFIIDIIKTFENTSEEIVEKNNKESLKKERVKEIAGEGFWNGKIYGSAKNGYSVYVANKKYTISESDYKLFDLK